MKNSNIFLRQYVLRNDIELISLWSMFTGYGVELADKKRYAWSPLFKVLIGKKTESKKGDFALAKAATYRCDKIPH